MRVLLAVALVAALVATARADDDSTRGEKGTIGIGLIFGEPTGISAKLYLKDDQAIQAAAGFAFVGGGLHLHADYVFHPYVLQTKESFVLLFYLGPGLRVIDYRNTSADNYVAIGLRAVAGLVFDFKTIPLDAFVEVGGVLEHGLSGGHGFAPRLNAAAGVRYYF
jgi:hypothetical protein